MAESLRVLLVDDEPSIIKMVVRRLEVEGHRVAVAMDGQEALKKIEANAPDVIVLDVMLPKLNGYEVCTRLKQDPRYRHIPIVMFSAKGQPADEQIGMQCGAEAYLIKPFQPQALLDEIREAASRSRPAAPPPARS